MLVSMSTMLRQAQKGGYAVGAFNVYDLQGTQAVIAAAQEQSSPVVLQIHPGALKSGGTPLVALCLEAGRAATVPVAVHLDHGSSLDVVRCALEAGMSSVMADGSHLTYAENVAFTQLVSQLARAKGCSVEAELGRLSGTEDGLTVAEYEARQTAPEQAADFVSQTGIDALAVCIGNVHGPYSGEPKLDFERLERIRGHVSVPLVLHGVSGLPNTMIIHAIKLGVCKFNVNTEIREAYIQSAKHYLAGTARSELTELMLVTVRAMQGLIASKIVLFGSAGKARISLHA